MKKEQKTGQKAKRERKMEKKENKEDKRYKEILQGPHVGAPRKKEERQR